MIYLDHAAATPVSQKVAEAMWPFFGEKFFNPSAAYLPAKRVREEYEAAKNEIAHSIGAKGEELVMTAGATESINLAFSVLAEGGKALVLATEHAAVMNSAKAYGDFDVIAVDIDGVIDMKDFQAKLADPEVRLISVALVNNELGAIQPMAEIAAAVREARAERVKAGVRTPIYLHSDASQALNLLDVNVARLGVDMMTLNAAKIYGPKGVGALYAGRNVKLTPVTMGGGQERGLRSGTENVAGVVGFAEAMKIAREHLNGNRKKYAELADILREELAAGEVEPMFLGNPKKQVKNFVPICYPGLDAERLIYRLEEEGVLVSTGAACAASKGQKSQTLVAIGLTDEEIAGSLRISLGETNDAEQMREAGRLIAEAAAAEKKRQNK